MDWEWALLRAQIWTKFEGISFNQLDKKEIPESAEAAERILLDKSGRAHRAWVMDKNLIIAPLVIIRWVFGISFFFIILGILGVKVFNRDK